MFYDNRVNLKESRDYSFLNTSKASNDDREDGASEARNSGAGRSGQGRDESKGSWGAFFGSKPEKSAAEKLAELRKMREQAEREKARKDLERLKADRIAASKKASVSSSGTPQRSGGISAGSQKSDALQKIQELAKHSRAQALKQARDFSDLLGNGAPSKPHASTGPQASAASKQKAEDKSESMQRRKDQVVSRMPKVVVQPSKVPVPSRPNHSTTGRQKGEQKVPREAERKPLPKEAPSKGGLAISSLATITPEGALVANSGISLDDAKRLKQGAKLLGLKLYFERDDKQRLKEEKAAQERRAAGKGGAVPGRPTNGSASGAKSGGTTNGGVPRSLDEERRRGGVPTSAAPRKFDGGAAQKGRPASGGSSHEKVRGKEPDSAHKNGGIARDRALGGAGRGAAFLPFKGSVKRKRPEEEMEDADSFLDEGEGDDEEGPSQEAVSSMIRKMFRYDPHKYVADDRDDPMMEVGFKRMQAEEARSARIAREEDEREAERLELEERRKEEKKKKKAASRARFLDD